MAESPRIDVGDEAPPLARGVAMTLRRAAAHEELAALLRKLEGRFALRSSKDPQCATIRFNKGRVEVVGGVDVDADVLVTADLDTLGQPGAPKPKVSGAARHPLLALQSSKLLDPPAPDDWREAVRDFVARAGDDRRLPALRVVCEDDGGALEVGGDGTTLEVHGPADALRAVFGSSAHPGEAWFGGRLRMLGTIEALSHFAGVAQSLMVGG